jgi:hypothetical protein
MGPIELISPNERFRLVDDEKSPTIEVIYRRMPTETYDAIRARHTTTVKGADGIERTTVDEVEVDKDSLDYIILEWPRGFVLDGRPAACSRQNKYLVPRPIKTQLIDLAFKGINAQGEMALALRNFPASSAPPAPEERQTPAA